MPRAGLLPFPAHSGDDAIAAPTSVRPGDIRPPAGPPSRTAATPPDLNVKGTATGGVPADLLKVADFNNGDIGAGLILMAGVGHDTAYPELDLAKYLNVKGRFYVNLDKTRCVAEDTIAGAFQSIDDVTVNNPLQATRLAAAAARGRPGHPRARRSSPQCSDEEGVHPLDIRQIRLDRRDLPVP
ncbi:hypothetical protein ABZ746_33805 [Streptomyces sp. NPDC020096]